MAKEITLQLTLKIPGCAITYAPTIELAKWILKRRPIDLIVSSPILPDGSVVKLRDTLSESTNAPDLVVVGDINVRSAEALTRMGYEYQSVRKISPPRTRTQETPQSPKDIAPSLSTIRSLGADLRNDLNNPLQEIVAMVFVAKASGESPAAEMALHAIDNAAKNMAKVVSALEDKIIAAVSRPATTV